MEVSVVQYGRLVVVPDSLVPPQGETMNGLVVALTGLAAVAISMGVARFAFTPILPMMQQGAGLSVSEGGWLASANYLGFLFGTLSAVFVRVRVALCMRAGLLLIGILTIAMAFGRRFEGWLVLRTVTGFVGAWVQVLSLSWALDRLTVIRRPIFNGLFFAGTGIGIAVTGLYCLALMQTGGSSALAWVGMGVGSLVVTRFIWAVLQSDNFTKPNRDLEVATQAYWNVDAFLVILCFGASGFGYIIPATFLPVMGHQLISDPSIFGWAWPVFGVATAIAPIVASRWAPLLGNRRLWISSHLIMAIGVTIPVWWTSIVGIILSALFVGGTFMVNAMASMQEAKAVAGANATPLIAAMTGSFAIGQVVGPISVSLFIGKDGKFDEALVAAAAMLTLSAVALAFGPFRTKS